MTLPIPNLDDRTYDELVQEALARIPVECPAWTDHNPSDTGIILIELLAWLTEMTLYRANQIPDRNLATFLSLLKGEPWPPADLTAEQREDQLKHHLTDEIRTTLQELKQRYRAITPEDFGGLILIDWPQTDAAKALGDDARINRVKVLPQRNLEAEAKPTPAPAHISLVIVPEGKNRELSQRLKEGLKSFLDQRRLLTTQLHVVSYQPKSVKLKAALVLADGVNPELVQKQAIAALQQFFQPTRDAANPYWNGEGWPFGRGVYLSELYQLLDQLPGVDYVTPYPASGTLTSLLFEGDVESQEIVLADNELVNFVIKEGDFQYVPVENTLLFATGTTP
jgi:hypothetical protein